MPGESGAVSHGPAWEEVGIQIAVRRSSGARERILADKRKRRMEIRIKRKKRAKRKVEAGFKKVITHSGGRRKVKFIKPTEA